jgi:hypothetical protein
MTAARKLTRSRAAGGITALALAITMGGAVALSGGAAASQPAAVRADVRSCGATQTLTFAGITATVRACLALVDGQGSPLTMEWSGDVRISAPSAAAVGYCRVELEGSMHAGGSPQEVRTLSCADFVNKGLVKYTGGRDGRATSDGWSQVTLLIGTNKGTVRILTASHEAVLT